jgi:tRNA (guanine37-N1)-methyltransferase
MRIDILTLFPEMFPGVLNASILGRAAQSGAVAYHLHNIRDWADNKHAKVDDRPFGGGPGMVMMCQPLYDTVVAVEKSEDQVHATRILLSPQGQPLDQRRVEELALKPRLLLIAGHYEGVDERVIDELQPLELSVGDYVVSGGEIPAMILIDTVVRLLPGVLGHEESAAQDSFAARTVPGSGPEGQRLLDCPHYTRPREWRGRIVPEVLLSGDHQAIEQWRLKEMLERTAQRRPDLLET